MSGGIRIRDNLDLGLTNANLGTLHSSVTATLFPTITDRFEFFGALDLTVGNRPNLHRALHDFSSNNTLTIEVPQYTRTMSRAIPDIIIYQTGTATGTTRYLGDASGSGNIVFIKAPKDLTITANANQDFHKIYRAGADDFNLSGFISIPPMILSLVSLERSGTV